MIHVRQYRPAFFEGFENWEGEVETLEELLAIDFIKHWASGPEFSRFSLSHPGFFESELYNLMAEIRDNEEWWVVALLKIPPGDSILKELPEWFTPDYPQKTP